MFVVYSLFHASLSCQRHRVRLSPPFLKPVQDDFLERSAVLSSVAPRCAGSRLSGCVKRGSGGAYDAEHVLFNVANLAQNHNRYYQICY